MIGYAYKLYSRPLGLVGEAAPHTRSRPTYADHRVAHLQHLKMSATIGSGLVGYVGPGLKTDYRRE